MSKGPGFSIVGEDPDKIYTAEDLFAANKINVEETRTDQASLDFLFDLIAFKKPKVIAEAGTFRGDFAISAARLARSWGGTVFTYDIIDYDAPIADEPNLVFGCCDFEYMRDLNLGLDFAFIDSGPPVITFPQEHELRLRHYNVAKDLLNPGGIIAVHDTNSTDWAGRDEIVGESSLRFLHGEGLSIWQKPHE